MAKTSKTKSIDKLTKLAEEYGVKDNPVIQELIEKYCSIQDLIEQMKVQIEKDGLTCTKVYSNGKENVYAHPLLDATKKFQDIQIAFYDSNKSQIDYCGLDTEGARDKKTFTYPATAYYVKFIRTESTNYQIELGSTATSYAPYSNECPISGWTGAEIEQRRKNLFDVSSIEQGTINAYGADQPSSARVRSGFVNVLGALRYVLSIQSGYTCDYVFFYNGQKSLINYIQMPSNKTFMAPDNCEYTRFTFLNINSATVTPSEIDEVQLEIGSTATDYEPYTGNQISVTFPTEAGDSGTVYGGTLTLNPDRTGTLVVDRADVDMGTLSWVVNSTTKNGKYRCTSNGIADVVKRQRDTTVAANILCEKYATLSFDTVWNEYTGVSINANGNIDVYDPNYNTSGSAADFKSSVSGTRFIYELASPQTYQLTAEQVSGILTTLYGQNNIWADTGDVTITAPRDTKLYIDGKLAEIQATILENIGG